MAAPSGPPAGAPSPWTPHRLRRDRRLAEQAVELALERGWLVVAHEAGGREPALWLFGELAAHCPAAPAAPVCHPVAVWVPLAADPHRPPACLPATPAQGTPTGAGGLSAGQLLVHPGRPRPQAGGNASPPAPLPRQLRWPAALQLAGRACAAWLAEQ
ncbi:MAG TPA: hypothetical protein VIL11_05415, partial [Limnochordales bacterium]